MGTSANIDRQANKRSVIGSIVGSLLLAATIAMALELVAMAAPHSAAQALARSSEGFVALDKQIARSGTLIGYPLQF